MLQENLTILKDHFGTDQDVAKALGISERHVRNIRRDNHVSIPLQRLIAIMAGMFSKDKKDH